MLCIRTNCEAFRYLLVIKIKPASRTSNTSFKLVVVVIITFASPTMCYLWYGVVNKNSVATIIHSNKDTNNDIVYPVNK